LSLQIRFPYCDSCKDFRRYSLFINVIALNPTFEKTRFKSFNGLLKEISPEIKREKRKKGRKKERKENKF
jgi:hypothetical protein